MEDAREAALSFFFPEALLIAEIVAAVLCLSTGTLEALAPDFFLPGPRPLAAFFALLLAVLAADKGRLDPAPDLEVPVPQPFFKVFFIPFTVSAPAGTGALGYMYGGGGGWPLRE
eukprot:CAMPEP_0197254556 /NCGR_PEP_ID=MMETSP1429-20130617/69079_1 /TAXON_ID=49237 /ORGANISM="Chaetoceros  sp., Strain UNC1202" /LENGTH=114 /DNA_ID=CAMNT_0042717587 /DNA_START=580 /DNA_END=924 /DNA_ORIENTATION=-